MERDAIFLKTKNYWLFKKNEEATALELPMNGTKFTYYRYYNDFGYFDGIAWYGYRYDLVHLQLWPLVGLLIQWHYRKVILTR
jgi:hypothetical protein